MSIKAYFKLLLFVNILLIIEGCTANNNDSKPFTEVININTEVFIQAEKLADPRHIIVVENYLFVGNKKRSPLVEVYDLSSKKMINSFLAIGNGPDEVLTIGNVQYLLQQNKLLVADLFKRKILSYNLEDVLKKRELKPEVIYERDEKSTICHIPIKKK
ncbi:MAG: 6-bladed beta-propeller [Bacteroidales bacterium]